jgi:hypothetical protein
MTLSHTAEITSFIVICGKCMVDYLQRLVANTLHISENALFEDTHAMDKWQHGHERAWAPPLLKLDVYVQYNTWTGYLSMAASENRQNQVNLQVEQFLCKMCYCLHMESKKHTNRKISLKCDLNPKWKLKYKIEFRLDRKLKKNHVWSMYLIGVKWHIAMQSNSDVVVSIRFSTHSVPVLVQYGSNITAHIVYNNTVSDRPVELKIAQLTHE